MEPEPLWQDGAGSLLVLAAAHETGLITTVQTAIPSAAPTTHIGRMGHATLRAMLLTLLFLPVVGLRRTWDLRSYSGDALALLTGRGWAYGYRHVERFLAGIAHAGAADGLTAALARWTTQLWHADAPESPTPAYPVQAHPDRDHRRHVRPSRPGRGVHRPLAAAGEHHPRLPHPAGH